MCAAAAVPHGPVPRRPQISVITSGTVPASSDVLVPAGLYEYGVRAGSCLIQVSEEFVRHTHRLTIFHICSDAEPALVS